MEIKDLEINLTDATVRDYAKELIEQLIQLHENIDLHSMNEYGLFLQGRKEMLGEIITYIRKTI